eukprot:1084874-Rhodomonas_salina.2
MGGGCSRPEDGGRWEEAVRCERERESKEQCQTMVPSCCHRADCPHPRCASPRDRMKQNPSAGAREESKDGKKGGRTSAPVVAPDALGDFVASANFSLGEYRDMVALGYGHIAELLCGDVTVHTNQAKLINRR